MMVQLRNTSDVTQQHGMLYIKKKLSILFILVLLPLVSAVNIDPDTIIQSGGLNLQFNFSISGIADSFEVASNQIYFQNFRRSGTEYISMNITETNANYLATALPYFSASTNTSKTITSGLSQSLDGIVTVDVSECDLSWTYKDIPVSETSCTGTQSVFNLDDIPNGNSVLEISSGGGTINTGVCSSLLNLQNLTPSIIGIAFIVIIFGIILSVIFGISYFSKEQQDTGEKISPYAIGMLFIIVLIGSILTAISALITTALCNL